MNDNNNAKDPDMNYQEVRVNLPVDVIEKIHKLADMQNVNMTSAIISAIISDVYLMDLINDGNKLLYKNNKGKIIELKRT